MSTSSTNPLVGYPGLPPFARITAADVAPAVHEALAQAHALLEAAEAAADATWDATIGQLERIGDTLERVWSPVGHLMSVRNSPELRAAYEAMEPLVVTFSLRVAQSEPLYRGLKELAGSPDFSALAETERRIVTARLRDAELGGIGLDGARRERFNEIVAELSALQTRYSNNVLDSTRAFWLDVSGDQAAGLPDSLRALLAQSYNAAHPEAAVATAAAGPYRVTLDPPVVRPFLEYADSRALRETVWRAHNRRAADGETDNSPLLDQILGLRAEMAKLLGFETFADLSLASKMADVAGVDAMHRRLLGASRGPGERELAEIAAFAHDAGQAAALELWDVAYWRRRLREDRFAFSNEQLKPYFAMPRVLAGLFALLERLFEVRVVAADGEADVWNPDVRFFNVHNSAGEPIAAFFLDAYSRPAEKRGGAWMSEAQQRWWSPQRGIKRLPVAYLICNGTPPVDGGPSLMSFEEVETLFHEFGHGLQHMLTTVDLPGAAGIANVEWDAVELPSQFMENWCYDERTLLGMAVHWQTGEVLPRDLFDKLNASRTFHAASFLLRQLNLGMVDIELHHRYVPGQGRTPLDVFHEVSRQTSVMPPPVDDGTLCSFSHIFAGGYAAGYYSYKWAEVLSADAFEAFEEVGLQNEAEVAAVGRRFRDTVLAMGGSRAPMDVFADFRGRPPEPDALLRSYGLVARDA